MENDKIYSEILENLILYNPVQKKLRIGKEGDGGYVIVDGYKYDCFLSAGIANEISFETHFIKNNPELKGFAFDGTVNRPAELPDNINFIKKNIDSVSNDITTNLKEYVENFSNVFIKMDIEGEEWNWIRSFEESFPKIKQFVFEAHAIFNGEVPDYYKVHCGKTPQNEWMKNILSSLKILNKTHYLTHIHQNILGPFIDFKDNSYPTFFLMTFTRKDCEINGLNEENLPIQDLDFPCGANQMPVGIVDKSMNFYPFKK